MARIVQTIKKVNQGLRIVNHYTDNTKSSVEIFPGDKVTDLSFVKDEEVVTVSGNVDDINTYFKTVTRKQNVTSESYLTRDAKIISVTVDHSAEADSAVSVIDVKEILEYQATGDVKKVEVLPVMTVNLKSVLSDGSVSEVLLKEGAELIGVTIAERGVETTGDYKVASFVYGFVGMTRKINVSGVVLVGDDTRVVKFTDIKVCGKEGMVIDESTTIEDAIAEAINNPEVGGIVLPAVTYTEPVTAPAAELTIRGAQATVPANTGDRATDKIAANETVLTAAVKCETGAEVTFTGVAITGNAIADIDNASVVEFKNCKFVDGVPYNTSAAVITATDNKTDPVVLIIDGCYFGSNPNDFYNLINVYAPLADGSRIVNNYFADAACRNNTMSFYNVVDGATIEISNNVFENSANAFRVGFGGAPKDVTLVFDGNEYMNTDPGYAGLVCIQPFPGTESYKGLTIKINNTNNNTEYEQLAYFYPPSKDETEITEELKCPVYIDGVLRDDIKVYNWGE